MIMNPSHYSKIQWSKVVSQKIEEKNAKDLLLMMKTYKKLNHKELSNEEYEVKPYIKNLSLKKSRTMIRYRCQMLRSVKFNFQGDGNYAKENWLCQCGRIQSQRHLEACILFSDLQESYDLTDPEDLVDYFEEVLKALDNETSEDEHISTASDDEDEDDETSNDDDE